MLQQLRNGFSVSCLVMIATGCYSPYEYSSIAVEGVKESAVVEKVAPEVGVVLKVEKVREIALKNNPSFSSISYAVKAAWSRYEQSLAAYYPQVTATAGLNDTYSDVTWQSGYADDLSNRRTTIGQAALTAEYVIFNGLIRSMNKLSAEHSAKASEAAYEDARRLLIRSVEIQYNAILLIQEKIRITKADIEFQEKLLKENELKYEAGTVSKSEVLNFRTLYNRARQQLIGEKFSLTNARDILAELMGLTDYSGLDGVVFSEMKDGDRVVLSSEKFYVDQALSNRPDLKRYREILKATEYALYSKEGEWWPVITAGLTSVAATSETKNIPGQDVRNNTNSLGYNLNMSWNAFDGFRRENAIKEARALVAQSELELESQWINVMQEVKNAYNVYQQRLEEYEVLKENVLLQTELRDLVETEYRAGTVGLTRLNEAQRDLIEFETDLTTGVINIYNAEVQLEASIGSSL